MSRRMKLAQSLARVDKEIGEKQKEKKKIEKELRDLSSQTKLRAETLIGRAVTSLFQDGEDAIPEAIINKARAIAKPTDRDAIETAIDILGAEQSDHDPDHV